MIRDRIVAIDMEEWNSLKDKLGMMAKHKMQQSQHVRLSQSFNWITHYIPMNLHIVKYIQTTWQKSGLQTLQKVDTKNISSGWPRQIYVNKNLKNAHFWVLLASAALLWIKFLKLKMEYGSCNISVHAPAISPSNICLECDGWARLTLDDLSTLTLTLWCESNLCSPTLTFVVYQ